MHNCNCLSLMHNCFIFICFFIKFQISVKSFNSDFLVQISHLAPLVFYDQLSLFFTCGLLQFYLFFTPMFLWCRVELFHPRLVDIVWWLSLEYTLTRWIKPNQYWRLYWWCKRYIGIWRFKDYKNNFLFLSRAAGEPSVFYIALNVMCLSIRSGFRACRQYNIEQCDDFMNKNSIMSTIDYYLTVLLC
jgi:hypothetical protein